MSSQLTALCTHPSTHPGVCAFLLFSLVVLSTTLYFHESSAWMVEEALKADLFSGSTAPLLEPDGSISDRVSVDSVDTWLSEAVLAAFTDPACGDGVCEVEYSTAQCWCCASWGISLVYQGPHSLHCCHRSEP